MTELHLVLSLAAMQALANGEELVIDVDGEPETLRVMLRCDNQALVEQVQKAMLHFLPVDGQKH